MSRPLLIIIFIVVTGAIAGVVVTRAQVLAAPDQPIPYSHQVHIEAGMECLYCHSSAMRSSVAGIPSVELCMGCHNVIATENPTVQQLSDYWEQGEPIPWVRVNAQPEFVFFSHQPHLNASLGCETCHGNVGKMDVARPVVKMDMGWCLECHLDQPEEKVVRLADCMICHK